MVASRVNVVLGSPVVIYSCNLYLGSLVVAFRSDVTLDLVCL